MTHYQMYWFLNEGENVDTIQFKTVEEYREWYEKTHGKAGMNHTGVHFRR